MVEIPDLNIKEAQIPVIAIAIAFLLVPILIQALSSQKALSNLPLLGKEFGNAAQREKAYVANAKALYRKGYRLFSSTAYRLTTTDGIKVVLPRHFLSELRSKPDDVISITKALETSIEAKHTGLQGELPLLNHCVRADLTQNLNRVNPRLMLEVDRSVQTEMPECEDWTAVKINNNLLRIVAIVSGHIFLGPELCRREEYINASINFTVDVFAAVRELKKWNRWLRPIGSYFTPQLKTVKDHHNETNKFLEPIIRERREMLERGDPLPDDMLSWMMKKGDKFNVKSDAEMAHAQLMLSMAAIHTTSTTLTHLLYDLAIRPELREALREEVRDVLKEYDGVFSVPALYHMKLLDSVMKESQRVNSLSFARFTRVVGKTITLSDGTVLPQGTTIEFAHDAIQHDPETYPNPETLDPYRFYNLRRGDDENAKRNQFVSVTETSMGFGYGRHACPGRFFANNEIKLILAHLLLKFDMRNKGDEKTRYRNFESANAEIPDPTRELMFKKVAA